MVRLRNVRAVSAVIVVCWLTTASTAGAGNGRALSEAGALYVSVVDSVRVALPFADSVFVANGLPGLKASDPLVIELDRRLTTLREQGETLAEYSVGTWSGVRSDRGRFDREDLKDLKDLEKLEDDSEKNFDHVKGFYNVRIVQQLRLLERGEGFVYPARMAELSKPIGDVMLKQLRAAQATNLKTLQRFETKFGPGSAQLNLVETVFNYGLLRGWDLFGVNDQGVPGPLEFISAYSTSYLRPNEGDNQAVAAVSGLELGLRCYIFKEGWGEGNPLKPAYLAGGALVAGERDGILRSPFDGKERWGAFFAWGNFKFAFLSEDGDEKFLVSKQFTLVPGLL